ncbi:unnamed protein product, partial [marine sediment metagenome]
YVIYTDTTGADFWGMRTVGDTALYVSDRDASDWTATVTGDDGGMVRSLNPTGPLGTPFAPVFERVNFGLAGAEELTGLELTSGVNGCPSSNVLWAADICQATAANQARLWFFEDTLARQLDLESPANGAEGLSAVIGTDRATIEWEALCGATCYEVLVTWICPGCDVPMTFDHQCFSCSTMVPCVGCSGETCCKVLYGLTPGTTYYWKVRVGGYPAGYPTSVPCSAGCPMLSKWSDTYSFTTAMLTPVRCS